MTDLATLMRTGVHVWPVRVYFEDTDAFGIVYHANYLNYAERARTEMMRLFGLEHSRMMAGDDGMAFAVRRAEMDFRRPARLDDVLEVRTRVLAVGGATVDAEQTVYRPADDLDLVRMTLQLACVHVSGRPARVPADLRARLQHLLSTPRI